MRLRKSLKWWVAGCVMAGLSGCATVEDPDKLWPQPSPAREPQAAPAHSAESTLMTQARAYQQQQQWQSVIALAEQGLMIDRREPQWYLLLAQSYLALNELSQAERFAQQGMRYADGDNVLLRQFQSLLSTVRDRMLN